MARPELQAAQIAVIVMALATIALSASNFYFFNEWSDTRAQWRAARQARHDAEAGRNAAQRETEQLRTMIGVGPHEPMERVKDVFDADMAACAGAFPADKRAYHPTLNLLFTQYMQEKQALAAERTRLGEFVARLHRLEDDARGKLAVIEAAFADKADDFDGEKARLEEEYDRLTLEMRQLADQLRAARAEQQTLQREKDARIAQLQHDLAVVTGQRDGLIEILEDFREDHFEVADGEIRAISPRARQVWINRGRAHGLTQGVAFSVYGRDRAGLARRPRKAAIEVVRVIDDDLAECAITEDRLTDPILPGDLIYTPLWHPGFVEHFAVAGRFEIEGLDSEQALALVQAVVRSNGGVIDEVLLPDGTREKTGEGMSIRTRYLVAGESPPSSAAAFAAVVSDADQLGIETITLQELLDQSGYVGGAHLLRYGLLSDPADFQDVRRPSERGAPPPKFRRRRMPPPRQSAEVGAF